MCQHVDLRFPNSRNVVNFCSSYATKWWHLLQQPQQSRAAGKAVLWVSVKGWLQCVEGQGTEPWTLFCMHPFKTLEHPVDDSGLSTFPSFQSNQNCLPWSGEMAHCLSDSCVNLRTGVQISRTYGKAKWAWQSTCNSSPKGRNRRSLEQGVHGE